MADVTLNWPTALAGLFVFPFFVGLTYLVYLLFSSPLRRQERARLLLNLLEVGLRHGDSIEHTIQAVAGTGDRALGKPFRRLAHALEGGVPLPAALAERPWLLPPQATAMLVAGGEAGDLQKVLPACRTHLKDGATAIWTAQHYLMLLAFVVSPIWVFVFTLLTVCVFPKFELIARDMGAARVGLLPVLIHYFNPLIGLQIVMLVAGYLAALLYVGGPRLRGWLDRRLPAVGTWISFHTPWRRKRMQRDFSATLAVLLDAGTPEARAISLAADSAANRWFAGRARLAVRDLESGVSLPDAMRRLDDAGEFRWRLANAAHGTNNFQQALAGWQEALDAKAFQQEQTAAQVLTTSLVLLNGLFVALLAVAVFQLFIRIMEVAPLW